MFYLIKSDYIMCTTDFRALTNHFAGVQPVPAKTVSGELCCVVLFVSLTLNI